MTRLPIVLLVLLAALGCSPPAEGPSSPFRPIAGSRLLMVSMLDPAADLIWDSVHTIVDENGVQEIVPETDEEWTLVRNAAITLAESGNLLMMEPRAVDMDLWRRWSLDLVDAGEAAMQAAEAQDAEAIFDVGADIYRSCSGCHAQYWVADFQPGEASEGAPVRPEGY